MTTLDDVTEYYKSCIAIFNPKLSSIRRLFADQGALDDVLHELETERPRFKIWSQPSSYDAKTDTIRVRNSRNPSSAKVGTYIATCSMLLERYREKSGRALENPRNLLARNLMRRTVDKASYFKSWWAHRTRVNYIGFGSVAAGSTIQIGAFVPGYYIPAALIATYLAILGAAHTYKMLSYEKLPRRLAPKFAKKI